MARSGDRPQHSVPSSSVLLLFLVRKRFHQSLKLTHLLGILFGQVVPLADVGLKIASTGFVVETKFDGDSVSNVMTGYDYRSENYDTAEKKFDLNTTSFAVDISIRTI